MRHRLAVRRAAVCWAFLALLGCTSREPERAVRPRPDVTAASDKGAVLATLAPEGSAPVAGASPGLGLQAAYHAPSGEFFFAERGAGVAFAVDVDGKTQVLHNGRAGKPYAGVGTIALSPDGSRCAYAALIDGKWRVVVDGVEGERGFDAVWRPAFSPDGKHVLYQALAGERWLLAVDRTVNAGTPKRNRSPEFSADSSRVAFRDEVGDDGEGKLVVTDLKLERPVVVAERVSSMVVDASRSKIGAVFATAEGQGVLTVTFDRPEQARKGALYRAVHDLVLAPDGGAVAYVAERAGQRLIVLDDRELPVQADMLLFPTVRPGGKAVGAFVASGGAVRFAQFFAEGAPEAAYEEVEGLVYSDDGRSHAYAARRGPSWVVVVNGKEGPPFDRVVSPQFTPSGKAVVYRARQSGRRFVVVADLEGKTTRQHPPYEQVFPVLFTADGKSIAYGVKDGPQLAWKVEAP
jgi:hypothetical protein